LTKLKAEINKQDWSSKGKFPADLKPHLADVAIQAIKLNEYDDHFFNYMPVIFPYNKFTMTVSLTSCPSAIVTFSHGSLGNRYSLNGQYLTSILGCLMTANLRYYKS
jgi:hypothetical protein